MNIFTSIFTLSHLKFIAVIFGILSLSACAQSNSLIQAYDGPQRPNTETVMLVVPYELEILEIDGKPIKVPYIPDGTYQVELLPGEHQIAIVYKEYWGTGLSGNVVNSNVFLFKQSLLAGITYSFKHNAPKNLESADLDFVGSDVKITMFERGSKNTINPSESAELAGFIGFNYKNTLKTTAPATATVASNPSVTGSATELLKDAWKMADDRQRKEFKDWVNARSLDGKGFEKKSP